MPHDFSKLVLQRGTVYYFYFSCRTLTRKIIHSLFFQEYECWIIIFILREISIYKRMRVWYLSLMKESFRIPWKRNEIFPHLDKTVPIYQMQHSIIYFREMRGSFLFYIRLQVFKKLKTVCLVLRTRTNCTLSRATYWKITRTRCDCQCCTRTCELLGGLISLAMVLKLPGRGRNSCSVQWRIPLTPAPRGSGRHCFGWRTLSAWNHMLLLCTLPRGCAHRAPRSYLVI